MLVFIMARNLAMKRWPVGSLVKKRESEERRKFSPEPAASKDEGSGFLIF